jgi:hypothetical protein
VHSFSKLFSKILATLLKGRLNEVISKNQSAFVRGRALHDNFVLVHQVARKINNRRQSGVLLKLDLSRAFYSISWPFLFGVLKRMGFGDRLLKWISMLLNTANTKVLVNGVTGESFYHVRGLRQGDPTSPLLFVAGMEVLTAVVSLAVQDSMLSSLAGISAIQRISLFADDVVLFSKPVREELIIIKQILDIFGEASSLKVNYRKTTTTIIRSEEGMEDLVRKSLGCEIAKFPIVYLGLKLVLRPLTKAEWQPMQDKVLHSMPAWHRGLLDRAGRLVLIKAVILARPIHLLLIADPPVWLLEEIIKWVRAFFWAGKKEVSGGQYLVAWDCICRP